MMKFKIHSNSYNRMKMFTKLLRQKEITFKTSVEERLTISVAEEDIVEFRRLAEINKIQIVSYNF